MRKEAKKNINNKSMQQQCAAHKGTAEATIDAPASGWGASAEPTRKVHPRIKSKPSTAIAAGAEDELDSRRTW